MSTTFLIYPCILTSLQFIKLENLKWKLQSLSYHTFPANHFFYTKSTHYLLCVLLDLNELLEHSNFKGYRYNSYLLNLIALKLTYLHSITDKYQELKSNNELTIISECIYEISLICEETNTTYLNEM